MKKTTLYLFLCFALTTFAQSNTPDTANNPIVFSVYPNPVQTSFRIKTTEVINTIKIYNVLGKEIIRFEKQDIYLVSDLKKGIYLLHLETETGIAVRKLIIK